LGKQPKLLSIAVAVRHDFPFLCGVLYHIVTIAWWPILLCNDHFLLWSNCDTVSLRGRIKEGVERGGAVERPERFERKFKTQEAPKKKRKIN
jgi:hypothetical protein